MPSRAEIVHDILSITNWCEDQAASSALEDLATQVENMRCEKCNHRHSTSHCSKYNRHILGLNEGCLSWEAKEN